MSDIIQNGKGSKPRPYKADQYAANYDSIDWSKGRKPTPPPKPSMEEVLASDYFRKDEKELDECLRAMMGALHFTDENRRHD